MILQDASSNLFRHILQCSIKKGIDCCGIVGRMINAQPVRGMAFVKPEVHGAHTFCLVFDAAGPKSGDAAFYPQRIVVQMQVKCGVSCLERCTETDEFVPAIP